MRTRCSRYCGIAITGKIDEIASGAHAKKIDVLRAPGRLADESHAPALRKRVDRARLAGVRPPCECDFRSVRGRQITRRGDGSEELDLAQGKGHGNLACAGLFR